GQDGNGSSPASWKPRRAIYLASLKPKSPTRSVRTVPRRSNCRRSLLAVRKDPRRGVVDTSVLVAGIAGFKPGRPVQNPSACLLRDWLEDATFMWLVSEEILS